MVRDDMSISRKIHVLTLTQWAQPARTGVRGVILVAEINYYKKDSALFFPSVRPFFILFTVQDFCSILLNV